MSDQGKDAPVQHATSPFLDGLPTRVGKLEREMGALHEDSIRTRAVVEALGTQVSAMTETLKDFGNKLDVTRTKKPEWGAMGTWAGIILVLVGMAFAPMALRMAQHEQNLLVQQAASREHDLSNAAYEVESEEMQKDIDRLEAQVQSILGSRFTRTDGTRLEDKVDRLFEHIHKNGE